MTDDVSHAEGAARGAREINAHQAAEIEALRPLEELRATLTVAAAVGTLMQRSDVSATALRRTSR